MFRRGFKTWSEETSLRVRQRLGVTSAAPLDPLRLAELLSVQVISTHEVDGLPEDCQRRLANEHSECWSAITVTSGGYHLIVVNTAHKETRRNSDLAHELAHIILGHEPSVMFVSPQSNTALRTHNKEQEEEANWLAGCLLLPRDALVSIRSRRLSDSDASGEYCVSQAMLRYRLNVSGVEIQFRRRRTARP